MDQPLIAGAAEAADDVADEPDYAPNPQNNRPKPGPFYTFVIYFLYFLSHVVIYSIFIPVYYTLKETLAPDIPEPLPVDREFNPPPPHALNMSEPLPINPPPSKESLRIIEQGPQPAGNPPAAHRLRPASETEKQLDQVIADCRFAFSLLLIGLAIFIYVYYVFLPKIEGGPRQGMRFVVMWIVLAAVAQIDPTRRWTWQKWCNFVVYSAGLGGDKLPFIPLPNGCSLDESVLLSLGLALVLWMVRFYIVWGRRFKAEVLWVMSR